MIKVKSGRIKIQQQLTEPPTSTLYSFVDNIFYAVDAKDANGLSCVNGSIPQTISDRKGGMNLTFAGDANPSLGRDIWMDGSIWFQNHSQGHFESVSNPTLFPLPEEFTIVFRKMPGTDWERISGPGGDYYLGFGGGHIRVINQDNYLSTPSVPKDFEIGYIHVLLEGSTGNYSANVWKNGQLIETTSSTTSWLRNKCSLSTDTNASDHDWIAKFYKKGKMTDADRATYFSLLSNEFTIGQMPSKPYASNVNKVYSGSTLTAAYTYNGINAEDTTKTEYKWYELGFGGTSGGYLIHNLIGTTKSITYSGSNQTRVCVKVYDTNNNSWRFVNGVYS